MQFKFKLTLASGDVYFVDNVDSVLRVCDNNRAHRGAQIVAIHYAPMIESRALFSRRVEYVTGEWFPTTCEELRRHDINDIYEVDERTRRGGFLVWTLVALVSTVIAALAWLAMADHLSR